VFSIVLETLSLKDRTCKPDEESVQRSVPGKSVCEVAHLPERIVQLLRGHHLRIHSSRTRSDVLHVAHLPTELTSGAPRKAGEELTEDVVVAAGGSGRCDLGVQLGHRSLSFRTGLVHVYVICTLTDHSRNSDDRRPRLIAKYSVISYRCKKLIRAKSNTYPRVSE
jgi:hypothetical protein